MKICLANATDHTDGPGGTIGTVLCNASGKRAFGKRCDLFRVPRYDPITFYDLHGGPAGICVAHGAWRARFARPFVSRSYVVQVFLANFASAPRWVFTRRCFAVGRRADWAGGTRSLALDVLKETGLAGGTLTGLCGVAVQTRIAPKAHRTSTGIGQRGGAKRATRAYRGIQLFRCPTLWTR